MKSILKGIWLFCSYLFVPQRRPKQIDKQDHIISLYQEKRIGVRTKKGCHWHPFCCLFMQRIICFVQDP